MNHRKTALEIIGLKKSFDRPAVDGLDLTIRAGEFYTLLGPNGAGKTTTLRIVAGLLRPDAGSVSVWGIDVRPNGFTASAFPSRRDSLERLSYVRLAA